MQAFCGFSAAFLAFIIPHFDRFCTVYRIIEIIQLALNINDVTTIQRTLAVLESLEGIYLYAADTNRDTMVDISDATAVQMFLAEYDIPYSIGQVLTR